MGIFRRRSAESDHQQVRKEDSPYFDETTLIVRVHDEGQAPIDASTRFICEFGDWQVSTFEASEAVRSIARGEGGQWQSYSYSQRQTRVEWGASGAIAEFVLDVASGLTTETIAAAMGFAVAKISKRHSGPPASQLNVEGDLQPYARNKIVQTFELDESQARNLTLSESETSGELARFTYLVEGDSLRFEVTVAHLSSGNLHAQVRRIGA